MACNCITELEKKVVTEGTKYKGRVITKARLRSVFQMTDGTMTRRPTIEMTADLEGLKREQRIEVAYGFCPFCGTRYEEKKEVTDV